MGSDFGWCEKRADHQTIWQQRVFSHRYEYVFFKPPESGSDPDPLFSRRLDSDPF